MDTLKNERLVVFILATVMMMETIDASVLNTSLTQIAYSLHVNPINLKIAITTYLLASGAFIPMAAWLSDKLGIARTLVIAVSGFVVASILCGVAQSIVMLTVWRAMQGIFGAFMMPLVRLTIVRGFKGRIAQTTAKTAPIALLGNLLGPILGGTVTTLLNWRFIFFLNVPIGLAVIFFIWLVFPKLEPQPAGKFDWWGFLLLAIALMLTLFSVDTLIDPDISILLKMVSVLISALLFVAYGIHSKKINYPLVNLFVFKDKVFRYFLTLSIIVRLFVMGMPFLVPLYLQTQYHYSALHAGMMLISLFLGSILSKFFVKFFLKKFYYKGIIKLLLIIIIFTQLILAYFLLNFSLIPFMLALFVLGVCNSNLVTLFNTAIYNSLSAELTNPGVTVNSAIIQLSASFSVAVIAFILIACSGEYNLDWNAVLPKASYSAVLVISALIILLTLVISMRKAPKIEVRA